MPARQRWKRSINLERQGQEFAEAHPREDAHSARGIDGVEVPGFGLVKARRTNVDDPFGEDIEYYRRTAESIELRLRRIFPLADSVDQADAPIWKLLNLP